MEYVIGIGIDIICGILVGMDASKRGMSPVGWGLFVALFCIVGLPMYLIMRKPLKHETAGPGQISIPKSEIPKMEENTKGDNLSLENETRKCPFCAETIKLEAVKCRYCLTDLDQTEVQRLIEAKKEEYREKIAEFRKDNLTVNGKEYKRLKNEEGDAFCLGCRRIDQKKNLFYYKPTDSYYHENCIPE